MFKCNLNGGESVEGSLIAVDPVSRVVVLEQENDLKFVFSHQISRVEGDAAGVVKDDEVLSFNAKHLEKREKAGLEAAEQNIANINFSVTSDTQALFDRIAFLYPTRWDGDNIIVLDQYVLHPPYRADNIVVVPGREASSDGFNRLAKWLTGERKKLGMS